MTDSGSLYGLAGELLTVAASILDTTPAKAPAVQFVCHGPPPYDCCGFVAVAAGPITYAAFSRGSITMGGRTADPRMPVDPNIALVVYVLRCASAQPQGGLQITLPQAAAISKDAEVAAADGWSLWNGLRNRQRAGTLFAGWPCRVFDIDNALPLAPDGGCLGWAVTLNVGLDGYTP